MFDEYVMEREGFTFVKDEHERGFAIYKIIGEECYIKDIYVKPEHRKTKIASELADEVCAKAKEAGAKYLSGTVSAVIGDPTTSMKVLLGYGMRFFKVNGDMLVFVKEI